METIKNAIGLGAPAQQPGVEPVNAEQGAGTALEPYDAGNNEENVPAVTEAAANTSTNPNAEEKQVNGAGPIVTAAPDTAPGTNPAAAAIVSDGTEPETVTGASSDQATKDSIAAPQAVGASSTKTVDELGNTSTTVSDSKTDKAKTIGTAGWFKSTLQRRKSKGKTLETESEKGPKVPEKDIKLPAKVPDKDNNPPAQVPEKDKTLPAVVGVVAPTKQHNESPIVEPKDKKEYTSTSKEKKHKRGKSVSETLKSANPFKKRQSKAEPIQEHAAKKEAKEEAKETKHEELTALPVVPGTHSTDKSTSAAPVTEEKAAEKSAASDKPYSTINVLPTVPVSRYADEEVAPDEMPRTTPVAAKNDISTTDKTAPAAVAAARAAAAVSTPTAEKSVPSAAESTTTANKTVPAAVAAARAAAVSTPTAENSAERTATAPAVENGVSPADKTVPVAAENTSTTDKSVPAAAATVGAASDKTTPAHKTETAEHHSTTAGSNTLPSETAATASTSTPANKELSSSAAVDQPHAETSIPTINLPSTDSNKLSVPTAETNKSGKSPVVNKQPEYGQPKGENLSAIPTAGGIRLGTKAMEERRVSQDVRRKSFVSDDVKPSQSTAVPESTTASKSTAVPESTDAAKATETNHSGKDGAPTRRLSVFGKLKEKLKN